MENADKKLIGEHDFRNFCKMDAANVNNYKWHITSFEVQPCNERFADDQLWVITIKGSAFLWHQVRCMVAVLFLIGNGLESSNVIDTLLDVDKTPGNHNTRWLQRFRCGISLLRVQCGKQGQGMSQIHYSNKMYRQFSTGRGILNNARKLKIFYTREFMSFFIFIFFPVFKASVECYARQALQLHLERECRTYKLQASIYYEALLSSALSEDDGSSFMFLSCHVLQSHPMKNGTQN